MTGLPIAWSPEYVHPVPKGHKFPMLKYDLLPKQLMHQGIVQASSFFAPQPLQDQFAERVHDYVYLSRFKNLQLSAREQRVTGFQHNEALVDREYRIAEGTRLGVDKAFELGAAANIAGGTHHAYTNRGEGFCMLNDLAIAALYALDNGKAGKVLILDLDVHQGNGTAEIFANTDEVFTLSMHGEHNYPLRKEKSDLDVALPLGIGDVDYMSCLEQALDQFEKRFGSPDLILYQAGVDVLASDKLGKMGLTVNGINQREKRVVEFAEKHKAPLVFTMGGGYSEDIGVILDAHTKIYEQVILHFF